MGLASSDSGGTGDDPSISAFSFGGVVGSSFRGIAIVEEAGEMFFPF